MKHILINVIGVTLMTALIEVIFISMLLAFEGGMAG